VLYQTLELLLKDLEMVDIPMTEQQEAFDRPDSSTA